MDPSLLDERVKLYKADLGLAFDGDADRLVVVDHMGEIVDGDELLAICASFYKETGKLAGSTLVCTVMSNMGLEVSMDRVGIQVKRTKVGDRYVVELMRKENFNLGGEQSGHLIFRDFSTTGDGILAALCLLEVVIERSKSVAELKKCMLRFPQVLNSFEVPGKPPLEKLPSLSGLIDQLQGRLGQKGRILFRYSGTENKARVMVEGESESDIQKMALEIQNTALIEISRQCG
jgi:phosphoglucosamine mutase